MQRVQQRVAHGRALVADDAQPRVGQHARDLPGFNTENGVAPGAFRGVQLNAAADDGRHQFGRCARLTQNPAVRGRAAFAVGQQPVQGGLGQAGESRDGAQIGGGEGRGFGPEEATPRGA